MKYLLFVIPLFLCLNLKAQELPKKSRVFVRVFNLEGEKIAKGRVLKVTDSTLVLKKGKKVITVLSSDITYLKTKKSIGHNILLGTLGGSVLAIPFSSEVSSAKGIGFNLTFIGAFIVTSIGSGFGYLTTIFKKSKQYSFAGSPIKWQGFKEDMYSPQN